MNGSGSLHPAALAPRRVPEAYVRAEVASFPLYSRCAFDEAVIALDPTLEEEAEELEVRRKTLRLWRACEEMLVEHASGWSLDRIIAVRDYFWFGCEREDWSGRAPGPFPMHRYLRYLARAHVEQHPGVTTVAQSSDVNAFDALTHYRWLTFALPEDLLLAASRSIPPPTRVDIDPPLLIRRLLDRGVAEIHQHIGAGMDFPFLWVSALAQLANPELSPDALPGLMLPFGDSETFLRWLLAAAIGRCVLAEFLIRRREGGGGELRDLVAGLWGMAVWRSHRFRLLDRALIALAWGRESMLPGFYELRDLYGELHPDAGLRAGERPRSLEEVWERCDPLAVRLGLRAPGAGEQWLVRQGLAYLEERDEGAGPDEAFARVFWQGLRLRCIGYRAVVQRPMTAGLQWFVRFYGRIGGLRSPLRAVRPEVAYQVAGGGQPVAALEVRTSPGDSPFDLAEELREITGSWRRVLRKTGELAGGGAAPELGVVLHFTKSRDPQERWSAGRPPAFGRGTHAEPRPYRSVRQGGRYADFFAGQAVKARAVGELLRRVPLALWLVRGLDVASDELSVPTWVLVPLYRFVQGEAYRASVHPGARGAPALRLTAHVGEDFRHLMEGLRRIYECAQYLLGSQGGRMGHATALGIEPRLWAEGVGSVMMTAQDRLWDLVFEWRLYTRYRVSPEFLAEAPRGRPDQVMNQIRELSGRIFGAPYEPHLLAEAHDVLHRMLSPPMVPEGEESSLDAFTRAHRRLGGPDIRFPAEVEAILRGYREDERVFQRGEGLVDVTLDAPEIAALYAIQDALRRGVGSRRIVVEVNPTSNLLIGDLLDLRNHPILRLFPPEPREGVPPVSIAVGSDDPITFSTHLLREYSLLYEAASAAGYPERVVQEWLERVRLTGMDARFTVAWRPDPVERAEELMDALDDYLFQWRAGRGRSREAGAAGVQRPAASPGPATGP